MDYEPYDSSGTDDGFPPPHQNKISRGGRISGNKRPAARDSMPYLRMYDELEMEAKIHQLEQDAYISVLRAFKAQGDAISWEKEDLITELRKELRLSNEEHRDLLSRVNADKTIRGIREWRQSMGLQPGIHGVGQTVHDPAPSPSISGSRKKPKIAQLLPSQSFGKKFPFQPQTAASNQPSSSAGKSGPSLVGGKGKKQKSDQSRHRIHGGAFAKEAVEGAPCDPLVGRKVKTRWPEDNAFYEAVITDYNQAEGLHALVYDIGTANETWEWVNLSEISREDIQFVGEELGTSRPFRRDHSLGAGIGRGTVKSQSRKEFQQPQSVFETKGRDNIELLHTDSLIKEIERVISSDNPDPLEIQKAKTALK
ncbi:hypothetical protein M569_17261, partial [Genlisea aurea]